MLCRVGMVVPHLREQPTQPTRPSQSSKPSAWSTSGIWLARPVHRLGPSPTAHPTHPPHRPHSPGAPSPFLCIQSATNRILHQLAFLDPFVSRTGLAALLRNPNKVGSQWWAPWVGRLRPRASDSCDSASSEHPPGMSHAGVCRAGKYSVTCSWLMLCGAKLSPAECRGGRHGGRLEKGLRACMPPSLLMPTP